MFKTLNVHVGIIVKWSTLIVLCGVEHFKLRKSVTLFLQVIDRNGFEISITGDCCSFQTR